MAGTPTRPPVKIPDELLDAARHTLNLEDAPYGVVIRAALIRVTGLAMDPYLRPGRPTKSNNPEATP